MKSMGLEQRDVDEVKAQVKVRRVEQGLKKIGAAKGIITTIGDDTFIQVKLSEGTICCFKSDSFRLLRRLIKDYCHTHFACLKQVLIIDNH